MKRFLTNIWFNVLLILGLTVLSLVFALYDSYKTVWATISRMNLWELLLIMFWGFLPFLLWGVILTVLGKTIKKDYSLRQGIANAYIGGFVSGITPSSTGGQFAQTYAYRKSGLKTSQGAGLIWMDFFVHQFVIVIMAVALYLIFLNTFNNAAISVVFGVGLFANSVVVLLLWLMIQFPKLYHKIMFWGIHLMHRFKFIKNKEKILEDWNATMTHFNDAIKAVSKNRKVFWQITGLYVVRMTLYFATPFAIGQLLGTSLDWNDFFPMLALAGFVSISNTFIPLPGSSGATESLFVLVFSVVIGKSAAASTMILWRLTNFYIPLLVGGTLFIRLRQINPLKPIQTDELFKESDDEPNA